MKKLVGIVIAVAVLAGVASVYAGDMGCCAAGKKTSASCCSAMGAKMNLTADQQARVAALKDSCTKATSKSERIAMMSEGMARILTPAQYAQWKASCNMAVKNGQCPFTTATSCGGKSS